MNYILRPLLVLFLLSLWTSVFSQFKKITVNNVNKPMHVQGVKAESSLLLPTVNKGVTGLPFSSILSSNKLVDYKLNKDIEVFKDGYFTSEQALGKSTLSTQQLITDVYKEYLHKSKINNTALSFEKLSEEQDDHQINHVRVQQYYRGVPVFYGISNLHIPENNAAYLNGNIYDVDNSLMVIPSLDERDIKSIVSGLYGDLDKEWSKEQEWLVSEVFNPKLVIYHLEDQPRLSYEVSYHPDITKVRSMMIDAHTGEVLRSYISTCNFTGMAGGHSHEYERTVCSQGHAHKHIDKPVSMLDGPAVATATTLGNQSVNINTYELGSSYYLIDASRDMFSSVAGLPNDPQGVIWTLDAFNTTPQNNDFSYDHVTSFNNNWSSNPTGVTAHHNAALAYEYFRDNFGRLSINGQGGNIISFINVADENGNSMGNAFWSSIAIFYGNGDSAFESLAKALDVAGHEMSHGIIQNTANLEYYGESGALNESLADVFGAMIDRDDWFIGEEVARTNVFPTGILRNMQNPNQGLATNDFGRGWQPMHMDQKFNGEADNAGVHINSGIVNHAFYLLATDIGKEKAEKLVYQSLTRHLTRSSQFIDYRNAMIMSANELYGATEADAVRNAFSEVGIGEGAGTTIEQDVEENPGEDLVIFTSASFEGIFINDPIGGPTDNTQISTSRPKSKPSLTDDASRIYFINEDSRMHRITLDFANGTLEETIVQNDPVWRNVVVSKDGSKVAALMDDEINEIWVFDFNLGEWNIFELFNPTFTEGVSTGDVLYADAMEFDFTGNYIMYDAINSISGANGSTIEYWDVGFIEIWDAAADTWATGNIEKLFSALPDEVSIGNPAFSKNSPYIIAFDYFDGNDYQLLSANIERGDVGLIFENNGLSYPSFSTDDANLIFDFPNNGTVDLGIIDLAEDKLSSIANTAFLLVEDARWGTWGADGDRILSSNDQQLLELDLKLFPNPVKENLYISGQLDVFQELKVVDVKGVVLRNLKLSGDNEMIVEFGNLEKGMYFINLQGKDYNYTQAIVKP